QLRDRRGLPGRDLLCAPYRLREPRRVPLLDPRSEALSYVARLGPEFPFAAPLLWSTRALRSLFRERGEASAGMETRDLLGWFRLARGVALALEAESECPGLPRELTRAEWMASVGWALVLASAAGEGVAYGMSAERERLYFLLREMDPSLARRLAERLAARDLLEKALPRDGLAAKAGRLGGPAAALRTEELMQRLRKSETSFRRARRRLLKRIGLRKESGATGRTEAEQGAYGNWLAAYQRFDEADREAIRREIEDFPRRPLLSVVMPVFNTPERWLQRAIDSLREQLYPDWELCIADDGSRADHIRPLLERNRERDSRIRVAFRAESGGIAAASNSALALAKGEWIVLVDHDDELPEEAFYLVVREILRDPALRLLYSDEDKIDEAGRRFGPYFKPDFSYDLLLSENCISHLGVYHGDLLRSLGGFREGFDGSQDYDLALRFVERVEPRQIRHIPRILYHWRAIETSAAMRVQAKPYAYEAARKAIREHLERIGRPAEVLATPIAWGHRVRRSLPANLRVSLLLGAVEDADLLGRSIESIRSRTNFADCELLVVGRAAAGQGAGEGARFLAPPMGLAGPRLWNWAARRACGEILVFLEAPVEVMGDGWLSELASQAVRPEVGAVGARILAPGGILAEAGVVLGLEGSAGAAFRGWSAESTGYFGQAALVRNPAAVSASCLATRRGLFEECGGWDEEYGRDFWDLDYCLRLRKKGYEIVFTPYAELVRTGDFREALSEDRERFRKKWARGIARDSAYNPNLSLEPGGYGLAWPPRQRRPWRE
ncbi:MAG: glycosyltransferase, partial [Candidatus Methylacidiphilaceae bacterium]